MCQVKDAILELLQKGQLWPEDLRDTLRRNYGIELGMVVFHQHMIDLEKEGLVVYRRAEVTTGGVKTSRHYYQLIETERSWL